MDEPHELSLQDMAARLRDGRLSAAALAEATTTNFTADEIHQIGLEQVAEISAELDKILRSAGFTGGSVGDRLTALNKDAAQLYPNTDAGRDQLLGDLNKGVEAMYAKLPRAFATLATCARAKAGEICGSRPEPEVVTASAGTGVAMPVAVRRLIAAWTRSFSFADVVPRLEPEEAAAL